MSKKRAQSTLEYVIVLTAVVAAILIAVVNFRGSTGTTGLGKLFKKAGESIGTRSGDIRDMVPGSVSGGNTGTGNTGPVNTGGTGTIGT